MDVLDREGDLGDVDLAPRLGEDPALQVREEVAAADKLEHKVDVQLVLECKVELHDERVLEVLHRDALGDRALRIARLCHVLLHQHLERVQPPVGLFAHEQHGAKPALAEL
jgi:hypothetical protein